MVFVWSGALNYWRGAGEIDQLILLLGENITAAEYRINIDSVTVNSVSSLKYADGSLTTVDYSLYYRVWNIPEGA